MVCGGMTNVLEMTKLAQRKLSNMVSTLIKFSNVSTHSITRQVVQGKNDGFARSDGVQGSTTSLTGQGFYKGEMKSAIFERIRDQISRLTATPSPEGGEEGCQLIRGYMKRSGSDL